MLQNLLFVCVGDDVNEGECRSSYKIRLVSRSFETIEIFFKVEGGSSRNIALVQIKMNFPGFFSAIKSLEISENLSVLF